MPSRHAPPLRLISITQLQSCSEILSAAPAPFAPALSRTTCLAEGFDLRLYHALDGGTVAHIGYQASPLRVAADLAVAKGIDVDVLREKGRRIPYLIPFGCY
jgi:hypothetical protein